jgi:hypothetical protein
MPSVLPMFSKQLISYTESTFKESKIDIQTKTMVKQVRGRSISLYEMHLDEKLTMHWIPRSKRRAWCLKSQTRASWRCLVDSSSGLLVTKDGSSHKTSCPSCPSRRTDVVSSLTVRPPLPPSLWCCCRRRQIEGGLLIPAI